MAPDACALIEEGKRVPADRPIDGVDASAFLLGQQPATGRDHVIYFGSDSELMSVKWKTMKVVFRYSESTSGPFIKPQWPLIFDLIDDPVEEWDLVQKSLEGICVVGPVAARLGALQQSMAQYLNIKPGQESPATRGPPTSDRLTGDRRPGTIRERPGQLLYVVVHQCTVNA